MPVALISQKGTITKYSAPLRAYHKYHPASMKSIHQLIPLFLSEQLSKRKKILSTEIAIEYIRIEYESLAHCFGTVYHGNLWDVTNCSVVLKLTDAHRLELLAISGERGLSQLPLNYPAIKTRKNVNEYPLGVPNSIYTRHITAGRQLYMVFFFTSFSIRTIIFNFEGKDHHGNIMRYESDLTDWQCYSKRRLTWKAKIKFTLF